MKKEINWFEAKTSYPEWGCFETIPDLSTRKYAKLEISLLYIAQLELKLIVKTIFTRDIGILSEIVFLKKDKSAYM